MAPRNARPKNAIACCVVDEALADDKLQQLNEDAHNGWTWKRDTATNRARLMAEQGKAHLCAFASKKRKPAKADKHDDAADEEEGGGEGT